MNYTVYFEIQTYFEGETHVECGFISAETLTEAMKRLEDCYRSELSAVLRLEILDASVISMPKSLAEQVLAYNV